MRGDLSAVGVSLRDDPGPLGGRGGQGGQEGQQGSTEHGWAGLGWAMLGWTGLGWAGLGWAGLASGDGGVQAPYIGARAGPRSKKYVFPNLG